MSRHDHVPDLVTREQMAPTNTAEGHREIGSRRRRGRCRSGGPRRLARPPRPAAPRGRAAVRAAPPPAARGGPLAPVPSSASTARPTVGQGPSGATSRTPSARASRAMRSRSSAPPSPRWRRHPDRHLESVEGARQHPAVAAVVPGPAATSTPPASRAANRARAIAATDRAAGALHQGGQLDAACDGLAIPGGGLVGGEDGKHGVQHVIPSEAGILPAGSEARGQDPSLRSG